MHVRIAIICATVAAGLVLLIATASGKPAPPSRARPAAPATASVRRERLALSPDELHPGRHRRSRASLPLMGDRSGARRCSGSRCSRRGRTARAGTTRRRTTSRATRTSTTTRSPTRTSRWRIASLPKAQRARFDPMITGFNPADMYAADHVRRVLETFPGVFVGIGEFSIHKEFVTSKVAGEPPSLRIRRSIGCSTSPARSVSSCSCTAMPTRRFPSRAHDPAYFEPMLDAVPRASEDDVHLGPHRARTRRSARSRTCASYSRRCSTIRRSDTSTSISRGRRRRSTSSRTPETPEGRRRHHQAASGSLSVRHRRGRPDEPERLPARARHVRAAVEAASAGRPREGAQDATTSASSTRRARRSGRGRRRIARARNSPTKFTPPARRRRTTRYRPSALPPPSAP